MAWDKIKFRIMSLCTLKENHDFPEQWSILCSIPSHSALAKKKVYLHNYSQSRLQSQVGDSNDELILLDSKSKRSALSPCITCYLKSTKTFSMKEFQMPGFSAAISHQCNFKESGFQNFLAPFSKAVGTMSLLVSRK